MIKTIQSLRFYIIVSIFITHLVILMNVIPVSRISTIYSKNKT